ncbi:MAG: hypothetical protein JXR88_12420 [Clostridia bacterium]|nr:hypothetical protein [Clostridia bacterium]
MNTARERNWYNDEATGITHILYQEKPTFQLSTQDESDSTTSSINLNISVQDGTTINVSVKNEIDSSALYLDNKISNTDDSNTFISKKDYNELFEKYRELTVREYINNEVIKMSYLNDKLKNIYTYCEWFVVLIAGVMATLSFLGFRGMSIVGGIFSLLVCLSTLVFLELSKNKITESD